VLLFNLYLTLYRWTVEVISYTAVRAKLAEAMDKVNDDHRPVIITRQRGKPAVLISLDDFNSYVETDYLLSSPKNAARLGKAVRDLKGGRGRQHKLIR
jgi:antitoxin YefM